MDNKFRYIGEEELELVKDVLDRQFLCRVQAQKYADRLEMEFEKYLGINHALALNSGSAALQAAVFACGIDAGDEVIVAPYSYVASAACVLQQNAVPVFADVNPDTYCMSPASIEERITPRTKAIIVVHIFGLACEMDEIMDIARRHNLYVIEDCCQAYSSRYKNKYLGTIGDISCFSLQQSKHITCGDGGILVTDNDELYKRAGMFSDFGRFSPWLRVNGAEEYQPYRCALLGYNFRLTELQAAVACAQLRKLEMFNDRRKHFVAILEEAIANVPYLERVKPVSGSETNFWIYPMKFNEEKAPFPKLEFVEKIVKNGGTLRPFCYISKPLYMEPVFQNLASQTSEEYFSPGHYPAHITFKKGLCPILEKELGSLILSPLHHGIDIDDFHKTASAIAEVTGG